MRRQFGDADAGHLLELCRERLVLGSGHALGDALSLLPQNYCMVAGFTAFTAF